MKNKFQTSLDFESKKSEILQGLNKEQTLAVTHKDGPLLIIAGAGTGKTTVITRRIAYLIEQKIARPSEILALTFTEKAASEMEQRVDQLVPYGFVDMTISTFHAFGDRLLRDYSLELGLPANFKVLTSTEQIIFMRQNIYAFDLKYFRPISNPLNHIEALLSHFSRLKDELITPEDYLSYAMEKKRTVKDEDEANQNEKLEELARAYLRYQELMLQAGNLDFGDQIFITHKLLSENKKTLDECQKKFKYILVDEFQDTNFAQNQIVKLLAGKNNNITVVGDDDQSIYRFRGASISNILDFAETFKGVRQIVLNQNYRSTQEILDSSYKLIQNNNPDRLEIKNKIDKRLISPKSGLKPELIYCDTLSSEADAVVNKIKTLKTDLSLQYNDFAIIVRANGHAEPFIQSLNIKGIPFAFSGASDLYSRPEVKMLIAFLKLIVYSDDNLAFYQLATSELYKIKHESLTPFYSFAKKSNRSILNVLNSISPDEYSAEEFEKVTQLASDLNGYSRSNSTLSAGELLYDFLTKRGYLKNISSNPTIENELKISNIAKFFDRIAQFNHASTERGVHAFLSNLELILEAGQESAVSDIDPDLDAVNILTAHASKGLEWPVVFIVNCTADRFPSRNKRDQLPIPDELIKERLPEGDHHTQEERRLFYVASTRAKDYLFLSFSEDSGGKRLKKLSPFVMELLEEWRTGILKHKLSAREKIERFKQIDPNTPSALPKKFREDILRLSRQQIDDYYSCPKKFYYAHIIKIPLLENHHLMYGTAIHAALDHYFARKINKIKPNLDELIADFNIAFRSVGFVSIDQEKQRKEAGIETLMRFYERDQLENKNPISVEEVFEFSENNVKINGRYDLVYITESGESEICDFKTSDVKEQKEADRRIKDSTQMQIYALAWFEKNNVIPKTTLNFIESGLKGEITYEKKDLMTTKEMIFGVAEGIRKNEMKAKPDLFQCRHCPYKDICPEAKG